MKELYVYPPQIWESWYQDCLIFWIRFFPIRYYIPIENEYILIQIGEHANSSLLDKYCAQVLLTNPPSGQPWNYIHPAPSGFLEHRIKAVL